MKKHNTKLEHISRPDLMEKSENIYESENPGDRDIVENGVKAHASPYGIKCFGCDQIHGFVTSNQVTKKNILVKAVMQSFVVIRWREGKYCDCVVDNNE